MDYRAAGDTTQGAWVIHQQAVRRQEERLVGIYRMITHIWKISQNIKSNEIFK